MAAVNDVTGDKIKTKGNSDKFRDNFDTIDWGKKEDESSEKALKPEEE